ncbi:MAG: biopolymer transporter ExbD [Verrucomicrobiota bacterium]
MKFYRIQRQAAQVPIVSLIDILFILLVFFIVTMTFKKPREVLQIELPTVKEITSNKITDTRSVIAVDALGNVTLDSLPVAEGLLGTYLTAFQKQNPGRKLELEADRRLPLERLLQVWDALSKAGIRINEVPARIKAGGE